MSNNKRERLRTKQDKIIELAIKQGLPFDVPISEVQPGSPTVLQLHSMIWPDYEASIDSCLRFLEGHIELNQAAIQQAEGRAQ